MSDQRIDFYAIGYNDGYRGLGVEGAIYMTEKALARELTADEREEIEQGYDDGAEDGLDAGGHDDE